MGDFDAGTIRALLDLKDELSPALKEAQANTTSFGKGFLGSLKTIAKVGAAVLVGMGAAVLAVGVKMFRFGGRRCRDPVARERELRRARGRRAGLG